MIEESTTKPGWTFWAIAGLLAVWNLSGLYLYYGQSTITADLLLDAGYNEFQVAHVLNTPLWAHSAYAIAVNAGVLGVIFMLLRKVWALPMFILSLLGALLQDLDSFVLRDALQLFDQTWNGIPTALVIPIAVFVICAFEIGYAIHARARGWLT